MSKNYKYYYTTHKLPSRESASGIDYGNEYNDGFDESEEYNEGNYDQESYGQMKYPQRIPEDIPKAKIQPPSEPTQSVPKTQNKLPYCIVPVLYVPKRIVQKEEIARNKVLQNSLASLSRMENLFYKYKANYENDGSKQSVHDIDLPIPQKGNVQDYSAPNAYTDNSYYDAQYEYCTSNTNYDDDYVTKYRRQQFQSPFQDNFKTISVLPKVQSSTPNYNYIYSYEKEVEPTIAFANRRSNPYMDSYYDKQPNDIHQYTRDDWLACQERRLQNHIPINSINYNPAVTSRHIYRNLKNNQTTTLHKPASFHSIGINAIAEHDSKISQTSGHLSGNGEKRCLYCEVYTQTEPQSYGATITQRIRSSSMQRTSKSDFCDTNEVVQSHSTRSATMIPKLKTTLTPCNTAESVKSCTHERNSCDSRQRTTCQKSLRAMSPEAVRKFWK